MTEWPESIRELVDSASLGQQCVGDALRPQDPLSRANDALWQEVLRLREENFDLRFVLVVLACAMLGACWWWVLKVI